MKSITLFFFLSFMMSISSYAMQSVDHLLQLKNNYTAKEVIAEITEWQKKHPYDVDHNMMHVGNKVFQVVSHSFKQKNEKIIFAFEVQSLGYVQDEVKKIEYELTLKRARNVHTRLPLRWFEDNATKKITLTYPSSDTLLGWLRWKMFGE